MKKISDLSIAILSGGLGTRLRPALNGVPKAMAPIDGKPFMWHLLDWLARQGARHVVLCTGYLGEQIKDYFGDRLGPIEISYSQEDQLLGTAGALKNCLHKTKGNHLLALNGDTFCDADLNDFLVWHLSSDSKASVLLSLQNEVDRFGSVETDQHGHITKFNEKEERAGSGYVSAGIYVLNSILIEGWPNGQTLSMEYEVLPKLIGKGLSGYKTRSTFLDIGTPASLELAQRHIHAHQTMAFSGNGTTASHTGCNNNTLKSGDLR